MSGSPGENESDLSGLGMMSALAECGSVGLTAVGDSHAEADAFYRKAVAALDEEAAAALAPRPLP